MKRAVNSLLRQYGTEVTLVCNGKGKQVHCFFQPVNSASWQSVESEHTSTTK